MKTALHCSLGLLLVVSFLTGCHRTPPPAERKAPEVTVAKPYVGEVVSYFWATGQTASVGSATITPRVTGFIQSVHFDDGDYVTAGQVLFEIQPDEYEVALAEQQSLWEGAKAQEVEMKFEYERMYDAYNVQVATQVELAGAKAKYDYSIANVAKEKARWDQANINLGYCRLTAPISGKISHHLVDVGNLVDEQSGVVLATVIQQDPLYVYFTISENVWLDVLEHRAAGDGEDASPEAVRQRLHPFEIGLGTGTDYPISGALDYTGNEIDSDTGTITCRGIVANPQHRIMPGMFARVRVPIGNTDGAILVPETAVGYDQAGSYVYVLDEHNVVSRQSIELKNRRGDLVHVSEGLTADDRVVIKGLLRCRVGRPVTPTEVTLPDPPALSGQASITDDQMQALFDRVHRSVPADYLIHQPETLPEIDETPLPEGIESNVNTTPTPGAQVSPLKPVPPAGAGEGAD